MKAKRNAVVSALVLGAGIVFLWGTWMWVFCRFYVGPDQMAVVVAKHGTTLPDSQILAEDGQKGIRRVVLGEGRHFLNPYMYEHEIMPVAVIYPGKIGIVTSKVGSDLPEGEFLADPGQKGIWRNVLGPGKYRLNPYGYQIDIVDAISIPIGYCGVITSLSGVQAKPGEFAADNEKGVRKDILQPGLYHINPKAYKIDVLEIGVNQVSLLGKDGGKVITKGQLETHNDAMVQLQSKVLSQTMQNRMDYLEQNVAPSSYLSRSAPAEKKLARKPQSQSQQMGQPQHAPVQQRVQLEAGNSMAMVLSQFVEFPSRDGFQISLDMTVEVELLPKNIAWIFSRYGDLPAVVDKIIMPQITSISRNKGSEYQAKDFIMGEGREKFQTELTKALGAVLGQKQIVVHNAIIRHVEVPGQILEPIQQASIAIQQNLTNMEKQNTAKMQAALNTETGLIEQRREQVVQETEKLKAEIKADEEKQVAQIKAMAIQKSAEVAKSTAAIDAEITRIAGQATADATEMVEGEKARGLQLKVAAMGDPSAYSLMRFADRLDNNVNINIIHAGEGTLWTDLKNSGGGNLGGMMMLKSSNSAGDSPAVKVNEKGEAPAGKSAK